MNVLFARNVHVQTTYPSFWPEKSKMEKYGPVFSVHSVSRKHYTNIKQWEYKVNKKVSIVCTFSSLSTHNRRQTREMMASRGVSQCLNHTFTMSFILQIVSLTELMAGVKAPTKTVQLFQLTCFPLGHKVRIICI